MDALPCLESLLLCWQYPPSAPITRVRCATILTHISLSVLRGDLDSPADRAAALTILEGIGRRLGLPQLTRALPAVPTAIE